MSLKSKIESLSSKDKKLFFLSIILITFSSFLVIGMYYSSVKDETKQKRVEVVKKGYFKGYSNNTIGFLLDNWKNCDSTVWGYFSNSKNQEIVEVYCEDTNSYLPLISYMKGQSEEFFVNLSSHKIVLQWRLEGKSGFKVDFVGSVLSWKDGREYIEPFVAEGIKNALFEKIITNQRMLEKKQVNENQGKMAVKVKELYSRSTLLKK